MRFSILRKRNRNRDPFKGLLFFVFFFLETFLLSMVAVPKTKISKIPSAFFVSIRFFFLIKIFFSRFFFKSGRYFDFPLDHRWQNLENEYFCVFSPFCSRFGGKVIHLAQFSGLERRVLVFFHQNDNWLSCKRKLSSVIEISVMLHANRL